MKKGSGKIRMRICAALTAAGVLAGSLPGTWALAEENTDAAMGRYVESDVPLPDDFVIESTIRTAEGNLRIFGIGQSNKEYVMYDSSDGGETWESSGGLQDFPAEENYLMGIALAPDGGGAGILFESTGGENSADGIWSVVTFDAEGAVHKGELPEEMFNMTLAFTSSGDLVGNCHSVGLVAIDRDTAEVKDTIVSDYGNTFGVCGQEAILLKDDEVQLYNLADGTPLERDEALDDALFGEGTDPSGYMTFSSMGSVIAFAEDAEGRLFYCTQNGIFSHSMGGSVVEQLVDGSLTSLSSPNGMFGAMAVLGQSLYVQYTTMEGVTGIHKYTYDETVPTVPQHELTVYSLKENSTILQAAVLFQKKYPDTYVNIVNGMTGDDGVTASDALRTLNTDILAGNGPDVLLLDGMSVQSYADKGVLADLSGVLQEVADTDGLLENIAKTYQEGDVIPAVPAKFAMEVAAGNPEVLESIGGLEDFVALASRQDALDPFTVVNLPEIMYPVCSGAWKKEDGTINQEKLTEFVSAMKQVNDDFRANASEKMQQTLEEYDAGIYTPLEDLGMEMDIMGMSVLSLIAREAQVEIGSLGGPVSYCGLDTINRQIGNSGVELLNGQLSNVFLPSCILSVLNTAKEQERAMDFVKFILTEMAPAELSIDGFSVNRKAFENSLYTSPFEEGAGYTMSSDDLDGNYVEITYVWPEKESLDRLADMAEQLDTRADTEQVQRDVVMEETKRCVSGEIGVDEAVNSIMQKINLYLAE